MTNTLPAPAIIPSFDDDAHTGRKLAIICSKGTLDMAYPGLVLANAALGEGVETHLFFTFWGFDMITKSRMNDLKFTILGNPATHMPQGLGGIPGMTAMATAMMKKSISEVGIPEVPEFLEQIVASGGHLWACRMSADMNHLSEDDLYEEVEGIISAADFIENGRDTSEVLTLLAAVTHALHRVGFRLVADGLQRCRDEAGSRDGVSTEQLEKLFLALG